VPFKEWRENFMRVLPMSALACALVTGLSAMAEAMNRIIEFLCAVVFVATTFSKPAIAQGKVAILMPGAGGAVPIDFLVRNHARIGGVGVSVIVTTSSGEAASISQSEAGKDRKVVLVGMSRGTIDVANAIAAGAKADGVILVSGAYDNVRSRLGSPANLPRVLIIHHRGDECDVTPPSAVDSFVAWSGGKASVRWMSNQGSPVPNPCGPRGAHGFYMQDGAAVSAINSFIQSR
jgi:hypothetical protein